MRTLELKAHLLTPSTWLALTKRQIVRGLTRQLALLLGTLLLTSWAHAAPKNHSISKTNRQMFTLVESVPLNSSTPSFMLYGGAAQFTSSGLVVTPNNNGSDDSGNVAATIASVPVMPYTSGSLTKSAIASAAASYLEPNAATLVANLQSWMSVNGYKAGTFVYEHQVQPNGVSRTMQIVWQVSITESGKVLYGDPQVIDATPTYVYMVYTPLAVAKGLPSTWAYSNAGQLQWQLKSSSGTPVTAMTTIQTNGAFDQPQGGNTDPNWGVECLTNKTLNANCPQSYVDAATLINQTSSSGAIIDYVRMVQPVYTNTTNSSGQAVQTPVMAMSINSRTFTPAGCASGGTYNNQGQYGFELNLTMDRFSVTNPNVAPSMSNEFVAQAISPTQSYNLTVNTTDSQGQLNNLFINPFDTANELVATSALPTTTYIAPLQNSEGSNGMNVAVVHMSAAASQFNYWNVTCNNGQIQVDISWWNIHNWCCGGGSTNTYPSDLVGTFTMGTPSTSGAQTYYQYAGYPMGTYWIAYDGVNSFYIDNVRTTAYGTMNQITGLFGSNSWATFNIYPNNGYVNIPNPAGYYTSCSVIGSNWGIPQYGNVTSFYSYVPSPYNNIPSMTTRGYFGISLAPDFGTPCPSASSDP